MKIGVIGGSGLYELKGLEIITTKKLETPFGNPSDVYTIGKLGKNEVYFLPRHGRGHTILPSEINHRANIFGFKLLGVERIISISAVGSLKSNIHPRDIVLPDQYFDRTKKSEEHTFFGHGIVAHISFAEPGCPELRNIIAECALGIIKRDSSKSRIQIIKGGTYVNMEGPAFSTKSESNTYRSFGFDVIGMTSLPEAKLSREAELCYQSIAMVTDYDCWHETESPVTVEMIVENLISNAQLACEILAEVIVNLPEKRGCSCGNALANAIITRRDAISVDTLERLRPIIGKYM